MARSFAEEGQSLAWQDRDKLLTLLLSHHSAFALDKEDQGETEQFQMTIDTGDAPAKRQPARRVRFVVRGEVARQLREMQETGVITPS